MFNRCFEWLLDLLYPQQCLTCRTYDSLLCQQCRPQPLVEALRPRALPASSALTRALGVYAFAGTTRLAIHRLKYNHDRRFAQVLAELLYPHLPWNPELLVPVPAHAERIQERGFNQAELIARTVSKHWRIPISTELIRTRATEHQVGRTAEDRVKNVQGAFVWQGKALPARVLVIDDVLTTGATLNACAEGLLQAGATEVQGLTVARAL